MSTPCFSLSFFLVLLLSVIQAAHPIIFVRFEDGQAYKLNKAVVSVSCTYGSVVRALHTAGHPIGLHQKLFALQDGNILVTDADRPVPKTRVEGEVVTSIWTPAEELMVFAGMLMGDDDEAELGHQALSPLAIKDTKAIVGLPNIRSRTCYMNAILQCLFHTPHLHYRLLTVVVQRGLVETTLPGALAQLMRAMEGQVPVEVMERVLTRMGRALGINAFTQQDSAAMLSLLLGQLNTALSTEECGNPLLGNSGMLDDLFGIDITEERHDILGQLTSSNAYTEFLLVLPPPQQLIEEQQQRRNPQARRRLQVLLATRPTGEDAMREREIALLEVALGPLAPLDLELLLFSSTMPEETVIDQQVMGTTSKCITKLPPYLFINFVRGDHRCHLENPIHFPLQYPYISFVLLFYPCRNLNMSMMLAGNENGELGNFLYSLKAVIMHVGTSTRGHCTLSIILSIIFSRCGGGAE